LRKLLFDLDESLARATRPSVLWACLRGSWTALKVKMAEVEVGLDIDQKKGTADSGRLESDLPNLFVASGRSCRGTKDTRALLIDELQYQSQGTQRADHGDDKMQQRQLPMILLGAGSADLPGTRWRIEIVPQRRLSTSQKSARFRKLTLLKHS